MYLSPTVTVLCCGWELCANDTGFAAEQVCCRHSGSVLCATELARC